MAQAPARVNRGRLVAEQNREALVRAARQVFADRGLDAPLYEVARRAGVGQGSLYRHFPDRTSLVLAVFDENVAHLESLATHEDATLDAVMDAVTSLAEESSAFMDAVASGADDPRLVDLGRRLREVFRAPVAAAREAGVVAPDIDVEDVMLGVLMLSSALGRLPAGERGARSARLRQLVRRGWTCPGDPPER